MNMRLLISLIVATFFSVSCIKAEGVKAPPVGDEIKVPNPVNKDLLLQLVNDVRKKGCQCGSAYYEPAPALVWNDLLEKAAYHHANDMFQHNFFSHTGQDGSNVSQRMERVGYHWMAYGENIGLGFTDEREVIEGWLHSPGHCKNLMNAKFKEMAVARVGNYWTQTLGAK